MMNAVFVGTRPTQDLSRILVESGCEVIHTRYVKGFLQRVPRRSSACSQRPASGSARGQSLALTPASASPCAPPHRTVVLHWRSKTDQRVIAEAKSLGVPVIVIAADLNAALQADGPFADLYLEKPTNDHELATFVIDIMEQKKAMRHAAAGSR
jgi:hypothetical protein